MLLGILIMLLGAQNYGKYPETNFDFIIHSNFIVQEQAFQLCNRP
jgi:hypothetical protein